MQQIPLDKATVDMTLAKPVTHGGGAVLAGAGLKLNAALLQRLKSSGVTTITVEGSPVQGIEAEGIDLEKMRGELDHLFRRHRQNPLMWVMRNMIAQYLDKRIGEHNSTDALSQPTQAQP